MFAFKKSTINLVKINYCHFLSNSISIFINLIEDQLYDVDSI